MLKTIFGIKLLASEELLKKGIEGTSPIVQAGPSTSLLVDNIPSTPVGTNPPRTNVISVSPINAELSNLSVLKEVSHQIAIQLHRTDMILIDGDRVVDISDLVIRLEALRGHPAPAALTDVQPKIRLPPLMNEASTSRVVQPREVPLTINARTQTNTIGLEDYLLLFYGPIGSVWSNIIITRVH